MLDKEKTMKKKGLIISTVVMVVVLITALTTATYAWFTTSNVTSISGFDVSVVSSNAVNIGLKSTCKYEAEVTDQSFVTGDCTFAAGDAGALGTGGWTGETGLSATVNHNITWGPQSKAVGVSTAVTKATDATLTSTGLWTKENGAKAIAANIEKNKDGNEVLSNQTFAVANTDYAYFFLGAQPTKELASSELVILVDTTQSTNVGILSALHVAYRLNSDGTWTDVDIFGEDVKDEHGKVTTPGIHYSQKSALLDSNLSDTQKTAYKATYGKDAVAKGLRAFAITGLTTDAEKIDQIEIVIYLAGDDSDCRDAAKGSKGEISMFFNVVEKATTATPTAATIDNTGKLTLTGVKNAKVEVNVGDGQWVEVPGSWADSTFTSTGAITTVTADATVQVRQTETGKIASAPFEAINNKA